MLILFATLLCAAGAAVLRGFQLASSFSAADGLTYSGDLLTAALMAFCGLFVAGAAVFAFFNAKKRRLHLAARLERGTLLGNLWLAAEMLAAAALFTAAVGDFYYGIMDGRVSLICLGVLGVLSALSVLLIALSANRLNSNSVTGFWFTIPVFWSCFLIFVDFWGFAANPDRNAFMYGMLALVACTLTLNAAAGLFFGKAKRGRMLVYALAAALFAVCTLGGSLIARFVLRPDFLPDAAFLSLPQMLKLAFVAFHAPALAYAIRKGWLLAPPELPRAEPEEEPDDDFPFLDEDFLEGGESE